MRAIDTLAQRPLLILGVLAAAFLAWVVADAANARKPPRPLEMADAPEGGELGRLRSVGDALHQVREGMSRAEVEGRLGRPSPKDIRPVERANGRVVFRTHYPAYLSEPLAASPTVHGYCEAVVEYDAAATGHPLIRVTARPRGEPVAVLRPAAA